MDNSLHFDLGLPLGSERAAKRVLGLSRAESLYRVARNLPGSSQSPAVFCKNSLTTLGVSYELPVDQLLKFREIQGPIIVVANHPLGAIDALMLMVLMGELRADFKFLGNSILKTLPELGPALAPVHIMGETAHPIHNIREMRALLKYLVRGGMMGLFPAGQVAAYDHWRSAEPLERPWSPHLGRIVKKTRATVLPLYFEGQNSLLFQYMGLALPELRIALLAREMLRYQRPIHFKLGAPIPFSESDPVGDAQELANYLKKKTYELKRNQRVLV
jgi:putative hemolysin